MKSAELFSGCGGLALGMSRAGFEHALMAEYDADAVATAEFNKLRKIDHVRGWPVKRTDVRDIDWEPLTGQLAVISGGPPCQPFGIGGKKMGFNDARDMWPEAIRAIREARPEGFLFENVRNLAGPKFRPYLDWIVEHLRYPSELRLTDEDQFEHRDRLRRLNRPAEYNVTWQVVNAADYGAPQIRFRVLIFGVRSDGGKTPAPMPPTHSRDRLLWEQFVTGEYWIRHSLPRRAKASTAQDEARIDQLLLANVPPEGKPWITVRDAISGLGQADGLRNHVSQPGARVYAGHAKLGAKQTSLPWLKR